MVTGCESWLVSLGRVPVVGEEKGPVCRLVGWSFVGGGAIWWAHTLFGCARTPVCVSISTGGCLAWGFARENGVGIALWFGVDVWVGSSHFEWFRVVVGIFPWSVNFLKVLGVCVSNGGLEVSMGDAR